jgi:lysophospholipase L1-like esterase
MSRSPSLRRKILFSLIPTLSLLVLLELISLRHYFRETRPETFGLQAAITDLGYALGGWRATAALDRRDLPANVVIFEKLYGDEGRDLLEEFAESYAAGFEPFAREVARIGSKLLVVYVPPTVVHPMAPDLARYDGAFFGDLAGRYGADYLDLSDAFSRHRLDDVALIPDDPHLSRFGNRVVAEQVARAIEGYGDHRSARRFDQRPDLLGDLPAGSRRIWSDPRFPFLVTINTQGLRMPQPLAFPKQAQRIVLLGDSFTFGYMVHDVETFPRLLQARLPDREIVNAGVPGYTIFQEAGMFLDRTRFSEPDITVLQVAYNDLFGAFSFERNTFSRDRSRNGFWFARRIPGREAVEFLPSDLERQFFERLRRGGSPP